MTDKTPTYSKEIIEIADILFAEPDKKIAEIMRDFAEKCGKSEKTIERWVKRAKEYNKGRIQEQERVKDEVLIESVKESFKRAVLTRIEAEEILSSIAKGNAKKINGELIVPSASEQIRAIQQLSTMSGWDAPKRVEAEMDIVWKEEKTYATESKTNAGD